MANKNSEINLWQLYYIINSPVTSLYSLKDLFWEMYISMDKEDLEEMGINTDNSESSIIREVIFEVFVTKILNKIIDANNDCKDGVTIKDWFPDGESPQ